MPATAERRLAGQDMRRLVPRSLHAAWSAPVDRRDPIDVLVESGRHRIAGLLPLRYRRMRQSPLAFLRGAAAVMAADLAATPTSGLRVQACGDAHHLNFGVVLAPDGRAVLDISDFDETHAAPFEWDLKRLATSLAVDSRARGQPEKTARQIARAASLSYRVHMTALTRMDPLTAWRSRVDVAEALAEVPDGKLRERETRRLSGVIEAQRKGFPKLLERHKGEWRLRERAGQVLPITGAGDDTHERAARTAFTSYRATLPAVPRLLLDRYRLVDVAFKTTGIASVGTFCAIGLYATPDGHTLLLQLREAQASVLAGAAGSGEWRNHGHRVAAGQRLMQSGDDEFLGYTRDALDDRHCYARRLTDSRLVTGAAEIPDAALELHAALCGQVLARAHARSGDAARLSGYMGSGGVMDAAVADFAIAYAAQTERDWRLFQEAIDTGVLPVAE